MTASGAAPAGVLGRSRVVAPMVGLLHSRLIFTFFFWWTGVDHSSTSSTTSSASLQNRQYEISLAWIRMIVSGGRHRPESTSVNQRFLSALSLLIRAFNSESSTHTHMNKCININRSWIESSACLLHFSRYSHMGNPLWYERRTNGFNHSVDLL